MYDRRVKTYLSVVVALATGALAAGCATGETVPVDDGGGGSGSGGAPGNTSSTHSSTSATTGSTTGSTTSSTTGSTTSSTTGSTTSATTGSTTSSTAATTAATTGGGTCAHDPCSPGVALDPGCDPCVFLTCALDDLCCSSAWDTFCVIEAGSFCGC